MTFTINRIDSKQGDSFVHDLSVELRKVVALRDRAVETGALAPDELEAVLAFQMADGSFSLSGDYRMPSDARVDFIYRPTYECCQALMAAKLAGADDPRIDAALARGLGFSCGRRLTGHGYEALQGQTHDLKRFVEAGLGEYIADKAVACTDFAKMIAEIVDDYAMRIAKGECQNDWGSDYMVPMMEISEAFGRDCRVAVFVYGTLMAGMCNVGLVEDCAYLGRASINGYLMYDLGGFPGVKEHPFRRINPNLGRVQGELRLADSAALKRLHRLEGEGDLYDFREVTAHIGGSNPVTAFAYVYRGEVDDKAIVPEQLQPYPYLASLKETHVWYACYGSNMLYERLMCYIAGGRCRFNGRAYCGCDDATPPVDTEIVEIPHDVYFGNESGSWGGSGAAFLDVSRPGHALGRAYLITREQYAQIHEMEGAGSRWYPDEVKLGSLSGIPMVTFTNKERRPGNAPSQAYLDVMLAGLDEAMYPDVDGRAAAYIEEVASR